MQSVLAPHGPEAAAVATLGWVMFAGGALICLALAGLVVLAIRGKGGARRVLKTEKFIVWSGVLLPVVVLAGLLSWGLVVAGGRIAPPSPGALQIEVVGEQWWWRVRYGSGTGPDTAQAVETANELRIPVGRDVELRLVSRDVIHSFWVPSLAGKVDMIPGMTNRLRLSASEAGVFRGQCAEYCGGPHALMSFHVVALEAEAFEAWLAAQRRPAEAPATDALRAGQSVFFSAGCHGCHTVRGANVGGVPAAGTIGPDLTHVAGRLTLGAATLPTGPASFGRWVRENQHLKPGNRMPSFGFLSGGDVERLASYLGSLK